jgi:hypothetical protein
VFSSEQRIIEIITIIDRRSAITNTSLDHTRRETERRKRGGEKKRTLITSKKRTIATSKTRNSLGIPRNGVLDAIKVFEFIPGITGHFTESHASAIATVHESR